MSSSVPGEHDITSGCSLQRRQIQYSQTVFINFDKDGPPLTSAFDTEPAVVWPHVTVGTLFEIVPSRPLGPLREINDLVSKSEHILHRQVDTADAGAPVQLGATSLSESFKVLPGFACSFVFTEDGLLLDRLTKKVVEIPFASQKEGVAAVLAPKRDGRGGHLNQRLKLEPRDSGFVVLRVIHSGLVLEVRDGFLVQAIETGDACQLFRHR